MRSALCMLWLLFVNTTFARAGEPWLLFDGCRWHFPKLGEEWRQRCCWCADDYCRKSLPCTPHNAKGCTDDYCRKTLPHMPCNPKGCADDYCPKKCSLFLGKLCEPWYRCGPVRP